MNKGIALLLAAALLLAGCDREPDDTPPATATPTVASQIAGGSPTAATMTPAAAATPTTVATSVPSTSSINGSDAIPDCVPAPSMMTSALPFPTAGPLGLAVVRRLSDGWKGDLWVVSLDDPT